jgi:hypothetical protein
MSPQIPVAAFGAHWINGEKKRAPAAARRGGKHQWLGIRRRSVLEERKLESRADGLKLTRKERDYRWCGMRNRRRGIAGRVFAFPRREDRDRAFVSGRTRRMDPFVQNWRSGEHARDHQSECAGQRKQFLAGTDVRCALIHPLAELSQSARN